MTTEEPQFIDYDNPQRALKIWDEYFLDVERLGKQERAIDIARRSYTCADLDIRLDRLTSDASCAGNLTVSPFDQDANGSWANAVKAYEEQ